MSLRSKWETHVQDKLLLVEGWARDGLSDEQIAKNLGIGIRTLYEYKEKYPQFLQALKKGKEVVDLEVENALLKRALGYDYIEEITEIKIVAGKETKLVKKVKKHMVGDVLAQMYWLNNRKPTKWKAKRDDVIEQDANITINIKGVGDGDKHTSE